MVAFQRHDCRLLKYYKRCQVETRLYRYSGRNRSFSDLCYHDKSVNMAANVDLSNSVLKLTFYEDKIL